MQQWEYKVELQHKFCLINRMEEDLNIMGLLGWELVCKDHDAFIFKRPLPEVTVTVKGGE